MSKTYVGIAVGFLGFIFQGAGIPFVASEAEGAIAFVMATVGAIFALYGRYKAGGIGIFGNKV